MAAKNRIEKQKLLNFILGVPFVKEDLARWQDELSKGDVTQDLLNDVHEKLMAIAPDQFTSEWLHLKATTEFGNLSRQWRMSNASKQFSHRK